MSHGCHGDLEMFSDTFDCPGWPIFKTSRYIRQDSIVIIIYFLCNVRFSIVVVTSVLHADNTIRGSTLIRGHQCECYRLQSLPWVQMVELQMHLMSMLIVSGLHHRTALPHSICTRQTFAEGNSWHRANSVFAISRHKYCAPQVHARRTGSYMRVCSRNRSSARLM